MDVFARSAFTHFGALAKAVRLFMHGITSSVCPQMVLEFECGGTFRRPGLGDSGNVGVGGRPIRLLAISAL